MTIKAKGTTSASKAFPVIDIQHFKLRLVGDSRLVCHQWDEKVRQGMRETQLGVPKQKKGPRQPQAEYLSSLYTYSDGSYAFPAIAFKAAAVDACSHVDGVTKVEARGAFHVVGELVKIDGVPQMREDMVRVGMGAADLRYRGEFPEWAVTLDIRHNVRVLSVAQIMNLFNVAGFAIGVGERRPQKDGAWGMFHVHEAF